MSQTLILGPPGTGKTTAILSLVKDLLDLGYTADDIALVSYSRAATGELRDRLRKATGIREWPNVRTLHSMATRLTGLNRFMTERHWDEFATACRFDLSPPRRAMANLDDIAEATNDDALRAVNDYARSALVSLDVARGRTGLPVPPDRLDRFASLLRRYKDAAGVADFTDVLEQAVADAAKMPCRVLFVDEAQDLSPLQIAFIEAQLPHVDHAIVAGDDDQAIFGFQAASADWIGSLARSADWETRVLGQSWRCPEAVRAAAVRVIARCADRVPKAYAARPEAGSYARCPSLAEAVQVASRAPSAFVLSRSHTGCTAAAREMHAAGIPYVAERGRGPNPFGQPSLLDAIATFAEFARTGSASTPAFAAAIEAHAQMSTKGGCVKHGGKTAIAAHSQPRITAADLRTLGQDALADALASDWWRVIQAKVRGDDLRYLRRLYESTGGKLPTPTVTVTTWHASKGREADCVVIPDHLPWPCFDAICKGGAAGDSEHRAAYVAITRARQSVIVVPSGGRYAYQFPAAPHSAKV